MGNVMISLKWFNTLLYMKVLKSPWNINYHNVNEDLHNYITEDEVKPWCQWSSHCRPMLCLGVLTNLISCYFAVHVANLEIITSYSRDIRRYDQFSVPKDCLETYVFFVRLL